ANAAQYIPALIDVFRKSVKIRESDAVKVQGYVVQILCNIGPPGLSALHQFLATAKPNEQAALALAWLEWDPGARDFLRRLLHGSDAMSVLHDDLKAQRT